MVTLSELSTIPAHLRTVVEVANFAELTAALRSGVSIMCTQDIVATSPILLKASTSLTANKITKDFAGDALIGNASDDGCGIQLHIDELTTTATGEGRLVLLTSDKVHIGGRTDARLGVGVWRPYDEDHRTCVEVAGSHTSVYMTGGLPDGDAGDFCHVSGGSHHIIDILDGIGNDDCVAVAPRNSGSAFGYRSISDVRIRVRRGKSKRSRLLFAGIPATPAFNDYTGSVERVWADVEGEAYVDGSIALENRGAIMVLNRAGLPTSTVRDFDITANVVGNANYCDYGVRISGCQDGMVNIAASGYSQSLSSLINSTDVSINA